MTVVQFTEQGWSNFGDVRMFSVKFLAAIAAVLLISAGAAQAGSRPFVDSGICSSQAAILGWPIEERGQAKLRLIRSAPVSTPRLASQHRPASKPASTRFAGVPYPDRRGLVINRLNAQHGLSIKFGNRPGSMSVGLKALAAGDIRFADRAITSSLSKAASFSTHTNTVKFCVGSMAPCSVSFSPTRTALNVHRTGRMTP
jgi:hypothetical protein